MIVHDLDAFRVTSRPLEANAKLVVHADAPLPGARTSQLFQPIAWRDPHIFDPARQIELFQLPQCGTLDVYEARNALQGEKRLRVCTAE
jgi:hypothetical protein